LGAGALHFVLQIVVPLVAKLLAVVEPITAAAVQAGLASSTLVAGVAPIIIMGAVVPQVVIHILKAIAVALVV
jgi:hypothetical protein